MECLVVVRAEGPDRFTAQPVGIPDLKAEAATEAEAVAELNRSLARWFAAAKLVRLDVAVPGGDNPWLDAFGRSADDPDFADFIAEIERARAVNGSE